VASTVVEEIGGVESPQWSRDQRGLRPRLAQLLDPDSQAESGELC
jgi:hypothetical protein